MTYSVKIPADSIGPTDVRLTTMELTYPLIIHNELMTHRMFSRNTASNRAIPVQKMIDSVRENPFIPERWPMNQPGMQAQEYIEGDTVMCLPIRSAWLEARDNAVKSALALLTAGVHKQITNRLLGPFLWTTAVVTATDWANFFSLRCHPAAQPEMQKLAYMMQAAYYEHEPQPLTYGEWHTPYLVTSSGPPVSGYFESLMGLDNRPNLKWDLFVSAGRCARVSYLRQGEDNDPTADFKLACRLIEPGHWSPFEHVALAMDTDEYFGNFRGFKQLRKFFPTENRAEFTPNYQENNHGDRQT